MVRIFDMTEEEVVALTDEQVNKLIDYECALDGKPMLPPHPGVKPARNVLKADIPCYYVAGFYTIDALHASRILEALNSGVLYSAEYAGNNYSIQYLRAIPEGDYHAPKIQSETKYSAELWDKIKGDDWIGCERNGYFYRKNHPH